jgi:hypothetical protein
MKTTDTLLSEWMRHRRITLFAGYDPYNSTDMSIGKISLRWGV